MYKRQVWQSIKEGGIGAGSLFHAARAAGWTDDGEAPASRPQSHQERPRQPEQPKAPPHDPRAVWDACEPATADQAYICLLYTSQGKIHQEKAEAFVQAEGDSDLSFFIGGLLKQGRK